MYRMTFNGITKDYVVTLRGKRRPSWAPLERELTEIPGMAGAHPGGTKVKPRPLDVPILLESKNISELQKMKEDLASWLITDEPKELIFEDEPDRTYYAMVDGSFDPEEIVRVGVGVVNFICPDPYKYGTEKTTSFIDSGTVNVVGTASSEPITKVTVKMDTTFLAISNGTDVNMIGRQADVQQTPFVREERKLWNEMGSLTGWTDSVSVEEGKITGTMKTSGYSFYTDSYGTDSGWHGPAKKISIGSSIQDFQVDALLKQSSTKDKVGSVEIALLDANNNFVAKMLMTKRGGSSVANWARIRAGSVTSGYDIMNTRGAYENTWANFDGMLRIVRRGNIWAAYACLINANLVQHTTFYKEWTDTKGISTAPITQVQIQLWQYGTTPYTQQYVSDLKVYKINTPTDTQVPIIAKAGDIIEFDHTQDIIRRNGEDIRKEKAFIGEYFDLKPGNNAILIEPSESIDSTEVRWRDRWR